MTGNLVLALEGDQEVADFLRDDQRWVMRMMSDIVDDVAEHAGTALRAHAPGGIPALVDVVDVHRTGPRRVEAEAGVTPDPTEVGRPHHHGVGSDPQDYPYFVDVGTGVHGEFRRPITAAPGHVMKFEVGNTTYFRRSIKGQPAQDYSELAFSDAVAFVPVRLAEARFVPGE